MTKMHKICYMAKDAAQEMIKDAVTYNRCASQAGVVVTAGPVQGKPWGMYYSIKRISDGKYLACNGRWSNTLRVFDERLAFCKVSAIIFDSGILCNSCKLLNGIYARYVCEEVTA